MKDLIKKLVNAPGPSGYEDQVREIIRSEIKDYADEIRVDALGSLIARKGKASKNGLKIMLSGHMDEIGVIATFIDANGFVRFTGIGGVFPQNCQAGRVRFLNGTPGVICNEMRGFFDAVESPALDKMFIDVGAKSKADCPVKVGDVGVFERPFEDFGTRLVSKAMDDRIACAILVAVLQQVKNSPHELDFVFSVQEEVGLRGAKAAAFGLNPDFGLAVDVTPVMDTPKGRSNSVELGKGPALKVKDSSLVVDPRVVELTRRTAESLQIPYQFEVLTGGGTDAGGINLVHAGVPSTCISVPTRYVHTPSEMVDYQDVLDAVRLVSALISNPIEL